MNTNVFIHKIACFTLLVTLCICCLSSCNGDVSEKPAPDVSAIQPEVNVIRFDKEMYAINLDNIDENIPKLTANYPAFTEIYFKHILPLEPKSSKETLADNFRSFLQEDGVDLLADTVQMLFEDMSQIESEYRQASQYLQYYLPDAKMPDVYTYYSGFAMQRFLFEDKKESDAIGVGLDMFLGGGFDYKSVDPSNPNFSDYITRSFDKNHMVKKTVDLVINNLIGEPDGLRLIDQMVNAGKKLYLTDKILPFKHDSVIMEYTAEQMSWCKANELEMWSFFFEKDLFYETNGSVINKYIDESPHSPGMPPAAPGRTADYLGWQIVKSYMNRSPEKTIQDLIEHRDAQMILETAKYKPKRKR